MIGLVSRLLGWEHKRVVSIDLTDLGGTEHWHIKVGRRATVPEVLAALDEMADFVRGQVQP